ncbi:DUF2683 family protein [Frigoriflavimonas asaccharolytica]|uniref:Uncharacterized protein (DUF342 family) n=1 Tax=Frigoriflavimonas asaccharolytica TaxID=2735899 RepID=A0A8J8G7Q4_9FLAO|nr:DUF2683 family protein [Frigoriflavimonas asaccharolytica]NRS91049.1 uncharacterized protein (DUF342 family) [Frigoriflavimonas asaccharolytica]
MMTTINVAIHPKSKAHFDKFKKALELIELKFELKKDSHQEYSEDIIQEIEEAEGELKRGDSIRVKSKEELKSFLASL